jgi:hypothetical protein
MSDHETLHNQCLLTSPARELEHTLIRTSHVPACTFLAGVMDDHYDSDVVLAESQRFVPQEDDEETLWEVVEITGERAKQYKVKWKGVDPKTNKPWEQSWVPKHDCTDDLVMEWRKKQRKKCTRCGREDVEHTNVYL